MGEKVPGHDFAEQSSISADATYTGYAVQTGADIPAWGGTVKLNLGSMDAKAEEVSDGAKVSGTDRLAFSAGYVYPLSKRTNVYWAGGFVRDTSNAKDYSGTHPRAYETMIGMRHRF